MDNEEVIVEQPLLRNNIDVIPYVHSRQEGILLKDSLFRERSVFVSRDAAPILALMNGQHSIRDIQNIILQQTGTLVYPDELNAFLQQLDENYLLDNERYRDMLETLYEEYKSAPARPALLAGTGYPEGAQELSNYLDNLFLGIHYIPPEDLPESLSGIVAPHIDLERGKNTYIRTYECVKQYPPADTYIILGVNHNWVSDNPFIVTDRAYETPLGTLPVNTSLIQTLVDRVGDDVFQDELAHRGEHSIEFHALFLRHLYPDADISILPVLCNFQETGDERVGAFPSAIRDYIAGAEEKVVVISSVDFTHIGPQFGWQRQVQSADIVRVEEQDKHTLALLADNHPDEFYMDIMKDGNSRNIDALAAGYTLMKILTPVKGMLIHYEQAYNPHNTVTFAGMLF